MIVHYNRIAASITNENLESVNAVHLTAEEFQAWEKELEELTEQFENNTPKDKSLNVLIRSLQSFTGSDSKNIHRLVNQCAGALDNLYLKTARSSTHEDQYEPESGYALALLCSQISFTSNALKAFAAQRKIKLNPMMPELEIQTIYDIHASILSPEVIQTSDDKDAIKVSEEVLEAIQQSVVEMSEIVIEATKPKASYLAVRQLVKLMQDFTGRPDIEQQGVLVRYTQKCLEDLLTVLGKAYTDTSANIAESVHVDIKTGQSHTASSAQYQSAKHLLELRLIIGKLSHQFALFQQSPQCEC